MTERAGTPLSAKYSWHNIKASKLTLKVDDATTLLFRLDPANLDLIIFNLHTDSYPNLTTTGLTRWY